MHTLIKQTVLVAGVLASSVSFAAAQAGPVDGKGQAGGTAHRGVVEPSGSKDGNVASGDYTRAIRGEQAEPAQGGTMQGDTTGSMNGQAAQPGGASSTGQMR